MHGKEAAVVPPLQEQLGLLITVPDNIDTDRFGTFSGETARAGNMLEAAVAKARLGMTLTGCKVGLASEGSFDGGAFLLPQARELLVLVDDRYDLMISEMIVATEVSCISTVVTPDENISSFLVAARFPSHGLIARVHRPYDTDLIVKGIRREQDLTKTIAALASYSKSGQVTIESDMRAHMNPTRMKSLGSLALKLAARLQSRCPECATPGFGETDASPGLPCRDCGHPTESIKTVTWGCCKCSSREIRGRPDGRGQEDPRFCKVCNP
jgi:predicted Zn-ribbon and HTH transcriptional regulator